MGVYLQDGLKIFHLDVAQAFVRAKLDTEIYMKLPGGCGDMSGKIVRLNRSLYGLKQSGRQWAGLLVETVVEYGMEQCRTCLLYTSPSPRDGLLSRMPSSA